MKLSGPREARVHAALGCRGEKDAVLRAMLTMSSVVSASIYNSLFILFFHDVTVHAPQDIYRPESCMYVHHGPGHEYRNSAYRSIESRPGIIPRELK